MNDLIFFLLLILVYFIIIYLVITLYKGHKVKIKTLLEYLDHRSVDCKSGIIKNDWARFSLQIVLVLLLLFLQVKYFLMSVVVWIFMIFLSPLIGYVVNSIKHSQFIMFTSFYYVFFNAVIALTSFDNARDSIFSYLFEGYNVTYTTRHSDRFYYESEISVANYTTGNEEVDAVIIWLYPVFYLFFVYTIVLFSISYNVFWIREFRYKKSV